MEIKSHGNDIVEIIDNNVIIKETDDVFGLFYIVDNCSAIIVRKENIINDFFNLSTGIAGEILQKFSNYNMRMAIIGDFENVNSKSLNDFIYESNKIKRIIFVKTIEEAVKIFNL
ncbi:MAG: DUF4180 domain-containing protein [Prevotellaceae bacterium]|jgi:hypothetical protein|nr:DUF4180 domain-containing protein [Prevotellaceae bacterium]